MPRTLRRQAGASAATACGGSLAQWLSVSPSRHLDPVRLCLRIRAPLGGWTLRALPSPPASALVPSWCKAVNMVQMLTNAGEGRHTMVRFAMVLGMVILLVVGGWSLPGG